MLKVAPWLVPKNHELPFSVETPDTPRRDGRALTFTVYDSPDPDCQVAVLLLHANGFCRHVWEAVLADLGRLITNDGYCAPIMVCADARSHGDSSPEDEGPKSWHDNARDALDLDEAVRRLYPTRNLTLHGIGHSLGAATLLIAEILEPRFASLLLVEPIAFPGPRQRTPDSPMVRSALKRKGTFASRAEARSSYESKPFFKSFDPRALGSYLRGGFKPVLGRSIENKEMVELKCAPAAEAEMFKCGNDHIGWERMPELQTHADLQGVVIMAGAMSDIYSPSFHDSVMSRLREGYPETTKGEKVSEPNTGHLVPMERPEAVAREAWKLLRACEPRLAKAARPRL